MVLQTFSEAREDLARFDAERWKHEPGMPTVRHVYLQLAMAMRVDMLDHLAVSNDHRASVYDEAVQRLLEHSLRLERVAGGQMSADDAWLASIYRMEPIGILGHSAGGDLLYHSLNTYGPYAAIWKRIGVPMHALASVIHKWEHDGGEMGEYARRVLEIAEMLRDQAFLFCLNNAVRDDARYERVKVAALAGSEVAASQVPDAEIIAELLEPLGRRLTELWSRRTV